jgi:hypothetical protein
MDDAIIQYFLRVRRRYLYQYIGLNSILRRYRCNNSFSMPTNDTGDHFEVAIRVTITNSNFVTDCDDFIHSKTIEGLKFIPDCITAAFMLFIPPSSKLHIYKEKRGVRNCHKKVRTTNHVHHRIHGTRVNVC